MADKSISLSFLIRVATPNDISILAQLHATAWRETYEALGLPANYNWPSVELRTSQWNEIFKINDGSWFCYVAENNAGELVGFAKGKKYSSTALPDFDGELNKIYVLKRYQQQGLGSKLLATVMNRFITDGIFSMLLFSEPKNPAGNFFELYGAEKLFAANGEFHGGYGWKDLKAHNNIRVTTE